MRLKEESGQRPRQPERCRDKMVLAIPSREQHPKPVYFSENFTASSTPEIRKLNEAGASITLK